MRPNASSRVAVFGRATVDDVVADQALGVGRDVLDDCVRVGIRAARQHGLDEALLDGRIVPHRRHRRGQRGEEADHIRPARSAVDAHAQPPVVDLRRVAGGAGQANVVLVQIAVLDEADRQRVRIGQRCPLGQVAEAVHVLVGAERGRRARLFERHEKVVRQQVRALGGGVKPQAVLGLPVLLEIHHRGEAVAEHVLRDDGGAPPRIGVRRLLPVE